MAIKKFVAFFYANWAHSLHGHTRHVICCDYRCNLHYRSEFLSLVFEAMERDFEIDTKNWKFHDKCKF